MSVYTIVLIYGVKYIIHLINYSIALTFIYSGKLMISVTHLLRYSLHCVVRTQHKISPT